MAGRHVRACVIYLGDADLDDEDRALRARLIELLTQHEGNVRAVATVLGKERSQLYKWFERLGIDYKAFRPKS